MGGEIMSVVLIVLSGWNIDVDKTHVGREGDSLGRVYHMQPRVLL